MCWPRPVRARSPATRRSRRTRCLASSGWTRVRRSIRTRSHSDHPAMRSIDGLTQRTDRSAATTTTASDDASSRIRRNRSSCSRSSRRFRASRSDVRSSSTARCSASMSRTLTTIPSISGRSKSRVATTSTHRQLMSTVPRRTLNRRRDPSSSSTISRCALAQRVLVVAVDVVQHVGPAIVVRSETGHALDRGRDLADVADPIEQAQGDVGVHGQRGPRVDGGTRRIRSHPLRVAHPVRSITRPRAGSASRHEFTGVYVSG